MNNQGIKKVICDSRQVEPGDLFVALKGARVDGHDFVNEAFSKGAVGALVEKEVEARGPVFLVDSTLQTLQTMARDKLKQKCPTVIGITGSLGKTTTKEFVAHLLSKKYSVAKSLGNHNSKVGLPLTILNDFSDEEVLVLEMGMTEEGNIKELVQIAPPDIALITSVAFVHAVNFADISGIARAKAEIFSHPGTKIRFAHESTLQFREVARYSPVPYGGDFESHLPPHLKQNALGALAVARLLKVDEAALFEGVKELKAIEGRGNLIEKRSIFFYNDAYNASEVSMMAALDLLSKRVGRKVAVLGQMAELGASSVDTHRRVGKRACEAADLVICLGEECRPLYEEVREKKEAHFFLKLEEVVACLKSHLRPHDHVLLKGSNKNQLWRVLDDDGVA